MEADEGIMKYLHYLAEQFLQGNSSISRRLICDCLDSAFPKMPMLYSTEIIKYKDLYEDLFEAYVEELSGKHAPFIPYNLYLFNNHRKIDKLLTSNALVEKRDILIRNLLQKKFLRFSRNDIQQIIILMNKQKNCRTTVLLENLCTLNIIYGRMTDIKSLLKLMSVSCQMFLISGKMSTEVYFRKRIFLQLKSLLITCKTRFVHQEHVSDEERSDFYDYLTALCCLYIQYFTNVYEKSQGDELNYFIVYMLNNSTKHLLDMILQIDLKHIVQPDMLWPLISKVFDQTFHNLSSQMYLCYVLAVRHICEGRSFKRRRNIKDLKKITYDLNTPETFHTWLTTYLPSLNIPLDKNNAICKYLMTCPENTVQSLIKLLSRKGLKEDVEVCTNFEATSDSQLSEELSKVTTVSNLELKSSSSSRKRRAPLNEDSLASFRGKVKTILRNKHKRMKYNNKNPQ